MNTHALRWRRAADEVQHRFAVLRSLLLKYSDDQPRAPAGTQEGGQWVSAENGLTSFIDALSEIFANETSIQLASDITGFTKHGINRMIERGISPADILDTMRDPLKIIEKNDGSTQYRGKNATIILNADGKVITGWPR